MPHSSNIPHQTISNHPPDTSDNTSVLAIDALQSLLYTSSDFVLIFSWNNQQDNASDVYFTSKIWLNKSAYRLLDYQKEYVLKAEDFFNKNQFNDLLKEATKNKLGQYATTIPDRSKTLRVTNIKYTSLQDSKNKLNGVVLILDLRAVRDESIQSDELILLMKKMGSFFPEGIILADAADPEQKILYANPKTEIRAGTALSPAICQRWNFSDKEKQDLQIKQSFAEKLKNHESFEYQIHRYTDKKNSEKFAWAKLKVHQIKMPGRRHFVLCTVSDNSRRMVAEKTLKGIFRSLVQVSTASSGAEPQNFFVTLARSLAKYLRISWVTIAHLTEDQKLEPLATCTRHKVIKNHTFELTNNPAEAVLQKGKLYVDGTLAQDYPNSEAFTTFNLNYYLGIALKDSTGKTIGVLEVMHHRPFDDMLITEYVTGILSSFIATEWGRLQANRRATALQSNLAAVVENNSDMVLAVDTNQKLTVANNIFIKNTPFIFGKELKIGDNLIPVLDQEEHSIWKDSIIRALQGEKLVRNFSFSKRGDAKYLDVSFGPVYDKHSHEITGASIFARDISYKRRAELVVHENQAKLIALIENTDDAILMVDQDFKVIVANMSSKRFFRKYYNSDVTIGRALSSQADPKLLDDWDGCMRKALTGERFDEEFIAGKDQKTHVEAAFNPVYTRRGDIMGVSVLARDVSVRKQREEELNQRNLELDTFVYRVSHDLRSPLCSIMGLVELIKMEESVPQVKQYLSMIETSTQKLDSFIYDLNTFSRNQRAKISRQSVNICNLIDGCFKQSAAEIEEKNITIDCKIEQQIPLFTDPLRLCSVFEQLISNAVRYSHAYQKQSFVKVTATVSNTQADFVIEDNGKGIREEYKDKVFDMFFKGNDQSDGTGLGLYITRQIVEKLGGTIKLETREGGGTIVSFCVENMPPEQD